MELGPHLVARDMQQPLAAHKFLTCDTPKGQIFVALTVLTLYPPEDDS